MHVAGQQTIELIVLSTVKMRNQNHGHIIKAQFIITRINTEGLHILIINSTNISNTR
jgi:hypothetical protein